MNEQDILWLQEHLPDPRVLLLTTAGACATLGMTHKEALRHGVFREMPCVRLSERGRAMWLRRDIAAWAAQHGFDLDAIRSGIMEAGQEPSDGDPEEEELVEALPARALREANVYRELYELQRGRCAICRTPHKARLAPLVIDHDHATGCVRGLLCATCNTALGQFQDRVDVLRRAVEYLTASPFAERQITYRDMLRHRSRIVKPRRRKPKPKTARGEFTA